LVLESLPIGRHTFLHFRPANFSVILDVPEGYTIFSQQAYLYFDESKSMRRLPPFKTEAGPFRADSPTEDGQLVFLAGVASEQSEITELTPADFKFMVVQETQ
jgi:hypothetical protein